MRIELPEKVKKGQVVEGPDLFVYIPHMGRFGHILDVWPEKNRAIVQIDNYDPDEANVFEGDFSEISSLAKA